MCVYVYVYIHIYVIYTHTHMKTEKWYVTHICETMSKEWSDLASIISECLQ